MHDIEAISGLEVPSPSSNAQRQRDYRARHGSANDARTAYRRRNSKWVTDAEYLRRPITFWDGEGITTESGVHLYTLFAAMSSTDYRCESIEHPNGLPTVVILDFVLRYAEQYPGAINAIYGGSYDFNMFLRDVDKETLRRLYTHGTCRWRNYKLSWRRGKCFYVRRLDDKHGVTIYDVLSFFQRPFVDACDEYLCKKPHDHKTENGYILHSPECWHNRNGIIASKARRGTFTREEAANVADYNESELRNGIELLTELRARLNSVTLRPRRWDGPGAVAAALMLRENVKDAKNDCPPPVKQAARYAYAGGRFEVVRYGHVESPAYEYDVNSAYPAALRNVPNLTLGRWRHTGPGEPPSESFSLVRVRSHAYNAELPAPLYCRLPNGSICYPQTVTGWYWRPEYDALSAYCAAGYGEFTILESWQYTEPSGAPRPFAFIEPLYRERAALKKARDGAHVGIKLALNSLYGKLAQQVGAKQRDDGSWQIPPFHQLEWAGYTTSYCRAAVLTASLQNLSAVIAYETDAMFSSEPLDVNIGPNLGDFEQETFLDLTYVQSGIYFATHLDGSRIDKSRGVDRGGITRQEVLDAFTRENADERNVETTLKRFVTLGVALNQSFDRWQRWEQQTKRIAVEPAGKRIHSPYCCEGAPELGRWHTTICPRMGELVSAEFPVEWINPNPEMDELSEMRKDGPDQCE